MKYENNKNNNALRATTKDLAATFNHVCVAFPPLIQPLRSSNQLRVWMQVITVGAFVLSEQIAIFQIGERRIKRAFAEEAFVIANQQRDQRFIRRGHPKGSYGMQQFF